MSFVARIVVPAGAGGDGSGYRVAWIGALRDVMHGDATGKLALSSLAGLPHLYAVGPGAELDGEISIFDSAPSIAVWADGKVRIETGFERKAAFLVYAQVERWREVAIPDALPGGRALERFVVKTARENRIAMDQPVPFLVNASPERLVLHVLRGSGGSPVTASHDAASHDARKAYFTVTREPVEIVGFYSDKHYGVFTHHDENLHMHVKTTDNRISGHVDELALARGAKLFLPVAQPR